MTSISPNITMFKESNDFVYFKHHKTHHFLVIFLVAVVLTHVWWYAVALNDDVFLKHASVFRSDWIKPG